MTSFAQDPPSAPSSPAAAPESAWVAVAKTARYVKEAHLQKATAELANLTSDQKPAAHTLLNTLAAAENSPAGLRAASQNLSAALPSFVSKGPVPPGQDPNQRRVLLCALLVFHGRVLSVAKGIAAGSHKKEQSLELLRVIADIKKTLRGANVGIAMEEEARHGLGPDLFDEAFHALSR
jgi:hypothetical protein